MCGEEGEEEPKSGEERERERERKKKKKTSGEKRRIVALTDWAEVCRSKEHKKKCRSNRTSSATAGAHQLYLISFYPILFFVLSFFNSIVLSFFLIHYIVKK